MLFWNNGLITYSLLKINNFPIYASGGSCSPSDHLLPGAYITLRGIIESISPTLEDAALDLGGSRWKVSAR
jgi:iron(III) transport system permease protein